tara:strand:- start:763 stop:1146 length:384 start_codon:yes stop_codon:yes gene_type:complete
MKIKYIRSDNEVAVSYHNDPQVVTCERGMKWWPIGAIVDVDASGKYLVDNGDAEPADDEMRALCAGWEFRRDEVLLSREMLAKCIDPEDRQRFRNGEILGYDDDGNDIPGPNYVCPDDDSEDEEDDE